MRMMTIVTHVSLKQGTEPDWDAAMRERLAAAAERPGWVGGQLLMPLDRLNRRVIVGTWHHFQEGRINIGHPQNFDAGPVRELDASSPSRSRNMTATPADFLRTRLVGSSFVRFGESDLVKVASVN